MTDELTQAVADWRPDDTEFVIFTKADWDRIRSLVPDSENLDDVELLPLTLDHGDEGGAGDGLTNEVRASFDLMYAKRLRRWIRRSNRWFDHCAAYQRGEVAWNPRLRTSKDSKHQAYADGSQLARLRGLPRPTSYVDLCALVGEQDSPNRLGANGNDHRTRG